MNKDVFVFMTIFRSILLIMRNVLDAFADKIKLHILRSITFFSRKSCRLWDNAGKCGPVREATNDDTIWRMCVACWVSKATRAPSHTHIHTQKYLILIAFPQQQWYCESVSVLRYTYIVCIVEAENAEHRI